MRKGTLVFLLGMILVVVPYLGVPSDWKVWATVIVGILLIIIGYGIRREQYLQQIDQGNGTRGDDTFVETTKHLFE
jgi:hypothetical protein